jgi:hypothetical protein
MGSGQDAWSAHWLIVVLGAVACQGLALTLEVERARASCIPTKGHHTQRALGSKTPRGVWV